MTRFDDTLARGVHDGSAHEGNLRLEADVVVIGSGAGGAVVAAELAEAGQRVVVIEEGPSCPVSEYSEMRPSQHMRRVWRDGGMSVALGIGDSPVINVTMGRCVGGSSMLTGGVCFRTPGHVLQDWERRLGLYELTEPGLDAAFSSVERAIHVEEVPVSMRSRSTQLYGLGAERMGFELKPLRRNTKDCNGCGRCNFGCPHGAKMSVDMTYLPRAIRAGAQIWSGCLARELLIENGRAVGVKGRLVADRRRPAGLAAKLAARVPGLGDRARTFEVRAKRVVLAAGSFHTPLLLQSAGVGRRSRQVGRNMTLHPGFRMFARFADPVQGWQGALQSAYSDAFEAERITMVGLFVPPGVLAATMHGFGSEHLRRARQVPHLAVFGGMIHDEGGGTVRPGPGREPVVTYRMARGDRATVPRIMRRMGETFFAAGALEVFPPLLGQPGVDADAFARLDLEHVPASRLECSSQHPLGSSRMGSSPSSSVVDPDGQTWDVSGLYVADGSIVPTSLGVNPQLTIMAMATRIAWKMREKSAHA